MSDIKDLFKRKTSTKLLSNSSLSSVGREVESPNYVISDVKDKNRFIPQVDFTSASNFAFYGSAEKYYEDSINYIINEYPYDGSGKEKINWNLSGTYLDRYIFENEYPRTNGFVVMGYNYGSNSDSPTHGYYAPVSQEYIYFKGGPNTGSLTSGTLATQFYDSNLYNTGALGKNNLELDGDKGLTLEFWLHKTAWNSSAESRRQVIFDLWNSASFAGHDYGRFRVEIEGNPEESNQLQPYFNVELYSGSHAAGNGAGWSYSSLSSNTTLALSSSAQFTGSWNHFALSFANSGSQMVGRLYRNGILENSVVTGSSMGNISGPMIGYIGALATSVSGGIATSGSAKLSASLDEVRYWKNERNSKNIGQYWWTQVNGGTNSDYAFLSQSSTKYNFSFPADLGVYYKFNEGITEVQSIDSTLLDYAGRTTNGKWIGYSTTYPSRNIGSAIINAGASNTEFKDPILYLRHPAVASYRDDKLNQGKLYDVGNNSSIYGSIPEWITSDDENKGSADLKKLTQIISSYFDTLQLQIQAVPEIKNKEYTNLSASNRPLPFADRLLDNSGFVTPEIFSKATELEYLASRNNHESFSEKLNETKNLIYENIYNNLDYIYKSKGTEKAFRNLIRCFGVGEELVKINLYADNNDFILRDNVDYTVARKKYVDFYSGTGKDAVVFQNSSSIDTAGNTRSFISSDAGVRNRGNTYELEALFPKDYEKSDSYYVAANFQSASLFGCHTSGSDLAYGGNGWGDPDEGNFQVHSIRKDISTPHAYFQLTSSAPYNIPELTSSVFKDVYSDSKWNFAVRVKPGSYAWTDGVSGSTTGSYDVEFLGYNYVLDSLVNSFKVTASVDSSLAASFLQANKRFYVGAHRNSFTGTVLQSTNIRASSCRVWIDYLDDATIKAHARDVENFGVKNPYGNAYMTVSGSAFGGKYRELDGGITPIPQMETLALNWDFATLTSSNASGQFIVPDASSGSAALTPSNAQGRLTSRWNWLGPITNYQHTGLGYGFASNATGSISKEYINNAKAMLPETLNSSEMVSIVTENEDKLFTRESRPVEYYFAFEKSMYNVVSQEILKIFATIVDFNNLIGEPVNRYRQGYKQMEKLRSLYFERFQETPNLEKFVEFYKWIDASISSMLYQLTPASSKFSDNLRTLVESHILERNKYWTKFPTLEAKTSDIEGGVTGINELLYSGKRGLAPVPTNATGTNCEWWYERTERDNPNITSDDATVDSQRNTFRSANDFRSGSGVTLAVSRASTSTTTTYEGRTFAVRNFTKPYRFAVQEMPTIHGGNNYPKGKKLEFAHTELKPAKFGVADIKLRVTASSVNFEKDCTDIVNPNKKNRLEATFAASNAQPADVSAKVSYIYEGGKTSIFAPFSLFSSSISPSQMSNFRSNTQIGNYHDDSYGENNETPIQGPFTDAHVGGWQYRHQNINTGANDTTLTRQEAWEIDVDSTGYIQLVSRNANTSRPLARPNGNLRRNTFAKRPVNIRNIKWGTSSAVAGNYRFDYEAVQTSGRDLNNRYLIKSEGDFPVTASTYVSGIVDFGLPRFDLTGTNKYIFVERFSAPGGPEINSLGSLDVYSQQYSVYNSLNFRNAIVRNSLDGWLTEHCGPYGIDPTGVVGDGTTVAEHEVNSLSYNGVIAAYHKVNRNPVKVNSLVGTSSFELTTSVNYDNWFIQHAIPQSAIQYKWVNDSYERIHNQPFGYISNFTQLTGTSTQTASMVAFVTESDYATPGYPAGASIPVNYSNMISLIPKESSGDLNASGYKYQLEDTTVEWYNYSGVTASSDSRTLHVGDDMSTGWNTSVASRTPLLTDQYLEFEIGRSNSETRYVVGLNDDPPLISAGASGPAAFGDMEYYMYIGPNGALSYQRGTHVSNEFTMGRELKNPGIINVGDKFRINHRGNKVAYSYQKYGVGPFREFYAYSGSNTTISGTLYPDLAFYWTGIGQSPLLKNIHIGSENTVAAGYGYYSGSSILTGGLNSYLLTLNGPYQGASWKNIRGDQKPIPRLHRKKNIYSVAKPSGTFLNEVFLPNPDGTGNGRAYYNTRPDKNKRFIEPAVSFNKPLDTEFDVDGHSVTLRNTYANNKCLFSQGGLGEESLGSFLGIGDNNNNPQFYDAIRDSENYNNLTNLTSREIIFPREANTTLAKSRGRLYYSEFAALSGTYGSASFSLGHDGIDRPVLNRRTFWRDEEKDRNRVSAKHRAASGDSRAYVSGTLINSMGFANGYSTSLYNFWPYTSNFSTNSTAYQATDKVSGNNIFDYPDMGELNCANFVQIAGLVGYATGNVTDFSLSESANFPTASAFYYHREFGKTNLGFSSYGVLPWRTAELSGKNPWYDSYEEYSEDIRRIGKNYSIVPEFNISEHMEYYSKNSFQFRTKNDKFLSLEGSNITSSAPQQSGSSNIRGFNEEFFKEYSHSDFQKYFASFENDLYCKKIKLKCNGIKKLLPYNGFYPSQRSLQLAQLLSQSVAPHIGGADRNVWRRGKVSGSVTYAEYSGALATQALIQPFYAPGIMYNTIKSGIAVDWGAYTGSIYQDYGPTTDQPEDDAQFFLTQPPNYRIPFETILDPIGNLGLPVSSSDGEGRVSLLYPSYRELFNENEGDGTAESTNYDRKPYFDLESEMRSVIDGSPEYSLYKLAASNFFAEIPNFFLKGNELKSIVSKPASDVSLVSGTTYFMDIYLSKDDNLLMIEDWLNGSRVGNPRGSSAYWSDNPPNVSTGSANKNRSWNGRFFGPPSRAGRGPNDDSTTSTYTWMAQGDPAYAPYTPPYFYGDCQLTIAYEADADDRTNFNYKKLFERAKITQTNPTLDSMFDLLGGATSSAAQGQMPLTASLNIYGIFNEKETRFDQNGNVVEVVDTVSSDRSKWVIGSRMETPVLDFSSQPDLTVPQGTGKGMWSGYGTIPSNSGIRFGIRSSGPAPTYPNPDLNGREKKSLLDQCFDRPQERKVGEIAFEKEISEAIIAIPFSPNAQSDSQRNPFAPTTQIMDKHFYKIRRNVFNDVYENYLNNKAAEVPTTLTDSLSIQKMLKLSEKYVLPPELDFLSAAYRRTRRNPSRTDVTTVLPIKPFVMYMFEFKHNLTDTELSDIWQGVMPDISRVAQKSRGTTEGGIDNNVFEHLTGPKEFFHGKSLHPKTRWMIFKVKRKANFNYFDVTADTTDDAKFKTQFSVGDFGNKFSYNWPYDYCSLVELAQVEVEGEFDKDPAPGTTSRNTSYAEEQLRISGEIAEE